MENRQITEYKSRINRVFDYIEDNLDKQFTLEELSDIAHFSKFHFNRIFYGMVGEKPFQFIQRVKLEKAASMLIMRPHLSITDIAYSVGFSDISIFSRNFKQYFNLSATDWRLNKNVNSNYSQTKSNRNQISSEITPYLCSDSKTIKWRTNMNLCKGVEIIEFPTTTVAYIRYTGAYKGNEKLFEGLWNKLFSWAGPRGLLARADLKSLIIYHDDPNITQEDKLRMSVCISVPENTKVEGEIGKMEIEGGKYAFAHFELSATDFEKAWNWVYGEWLPQSGYQPDDKPCFEMYSSQPENGKFKVDICIPVKPL